MPFSKLDHSNIKTLDAIRSEVENINDIALSVDCVIFGFDENKLKVLLMRSDLKKYQSKWSETSLNPRKTLRQLHTEY